MPFRRAKRAGFQSLGGRKRGSPNSFNPKGPNQGRERQALDFKRRALGQVSSFFPSRTLIRAFTAAVAAAIVLSVINTTNTKGHTWDPPIQPYSVRLRILPERGSIDTGTGIDTGMDLDSVLAVSRNWGPSRLPLWFRAGFQRPLKGPWQDSRGAGIPS